MEAHLTAPLDQAVSRSVVSKLTRGALALWQSLINLFASAFREQRSGFFAKSLDQFVADGGDEEACESAASEIFDLFDDPPFLIDLRLDMARS